MSNSSDYIKLPNNNWTKVKIDKLLEWQQQSRLHSLGHGRAQEKYKKKNDKILIPSISLGALAVFLDGIALVWEDQHIPFIIIALLLTAIATILDGVLQATKPVVEATAHENMCKGYNKIILQIDSMLAKEATERQNGSIFITMIEEELITLKTGGIRIPISVWTTVKKDFTEKQCDFQKLKDVNDVPSQVVIDPIPQPGDVVPQPGDVVPQPGDVVPHFELRIDDDPKTKKMEKMLFDIQMSRLG